MRGKGSTHLWSRDVLVGGHDTEVEGWRAWLRCAEGRFGELARLLGKGDVGACEGGMPCACWEVDELTRLRWIAGTRGWPGVGWRVPMEMASAALGLTACEVNVSASGGYASWVIVRFNYTSTTKYSVCIRSVGGFAEWQRQSIAVFNRQSQNRLMGQGMEATLERASRIGSEIDNVNTNTKCRVLTRT